MRKPIIALGLSVAVLCCMTLPARADSNCGDVDDNGVINIPDLIYGVKYLFMSGPPPPNFQSADFDRHELFTLLDVLGIIHCAVMCDFPQNIDCANDPLGAPFYPDIDESYKITYLNRIPAHVTEFTMPIYLNEREWNIAGFTLPLEIRVNGQLAQIDTVVFLETDQPLDELILMAQLHELGEVLIGAWSTFPGPSSGGKFAEIHLSVPDSPSASKLDVAWTTLTPAQGPAEDSSLYPHVVGKLSRSVFVPELVGSCCAVAGDADNSGTINIADITFLIERIFGGGPAPVCNDEADANGDNRVNIADVTYLIARIFAGGAAPVCGTTGS